MGTLKELRDKTGAGINACVQALKDTGGKLEEAVELVKKRGLEVARSYSDRTTSHGVVGIYQHHDKQRAGMVVLGCETDFVAKTEEFVSLANAVAMQVVATTPKTVEQLLKQDFLVADQTSSSIKTIQETLELFSSKCKEKIVVEEFKVMYTTAANR